MKIQHQRSEMSRGSFFRSAALFSSGFLSPAAFLQAKEPGEGETFYDNLETYSSTILSHTSPISMALQAGMAAPSPHNLQPWKFQVLNNHEALLYVDPERLLPETDPPGRQILIGHGTFLRMTEIGSTIAKLKIESEIFPKGTDRKGILSGKIPVAKIKATRRPDMTVHPLAPFIPERRTDRTVFDDEPITQKTKKELLLSNRDRPTSIRLIDDQETLSILREQTRSAFTIETSTPSKHEESRKWFRYDDTEIYTRRDGISLRGNGIDGIQYWIAKNYFLTPGKDIWHSNENKEAGINIYNHSIDSTSLFALLVSKTNGVKDWVLTGKDYLDFQVQAASLGLRLHPLSQIVQEYPEMSPLRKDFEKLTGTDRTKKVQLIVRVGRGSSEFRSPRRSLLNLIQNS